MLAVEDLVAMVLEGVAQMIGEGNSEEKGIKGRVQVQKMDLGVVDEILLRDEIDINYSPIISFSIRCASSIIVSNIFLANSGFRFIFFANSSFAAKISCSRSG